MTDFQAVQLRAFREEARELVAELETSLLALERTPEDRALVDRVFRAMHTIKGSSAMCGFDDISNLTHDAESLLDQAREGALPVTHELIDLALSVTDQVRVMVESQTGERQADAATTVMLTDWMKRLQGEGAGSPSTLPAELPPRSVPEQPDARRPLSVRVAEAVRKPARPLRCLRARVMPTLYLWRCGAKFSLVLAELQSLGRVVARVDKSRIPPLNEIDPTACYLSWDVMILTREDEARVREAFSFIDEHCVVDLEEFDPHAGEGTPWAGAPGEPRSGFLWERRESTPAADPAAHMEVLSGVTPIPRAAAGVPSGHHLQVIAELVGQLRQLQSRVLGLGARHPDTAADLNALSGDLQKIVRGLEHRLLHTTATLGGQGAHAEQPGRREE